MIVKFKGGFNLVVIEILIASASILAAISFAFMTKKTT